MTVQRRRGLEAFIWIPEVQTDSRGNKHHVPVRQDTPVKLWMMPERSAKAEVPGQQRINVIRVGCAIEDAEGVDLWSRVEFMGREWDLAAPPAYHHGTRHTRHYSLTLRERP